jgi:hypothetical protein
MMGILCILPPYLEFFSFFKGGEVEVKIILMSIWKKVKN